MKSFLKNAFLLCLLGACFFFCVACRIAQDAKATSAPAQEKNDSKVSAAVYGAKVANQQNPEGLPREAVAGELSVASAGLPAPSEKDRAEALARINLVLQGRLDEYRDRLDAALEVAKEAKGALDKERGESRQRITELTLSYQHERLARVSLIFAGVGAVLFALGAFAGVVSCFVADVPKVATSLRLASVVLAFFGAGGGSLPFWWEHPAFPWVSGAMFAAGAGLGGWLLWKSWREARSNKEAVRESVAKTITESELAHETLTLLAGQIDKLKKSNPEAAKALTEKLATTFDSDHEQLINFARSEAIKEAA